VERDSTGSLESGLSRRDFLRLIAAVAIAPSIPASGPGAARAAMPFGGGFLSPEELTILDAAAATLVPTDSLPGAREVGVVHYVQSLLTYGPGVNANCDRLANAADIVATIRAIGGDALACPDSGDVDGDGDLTAADLELAPGATFRATPIYAGGPFSGRQPQPHMPVGSTACNLCHGSRSGTGASASGGTASSVDFFPPDYFREHIRLTRLQVLSWRVRLLGPEGVPEVAANPLATQLLESGLRPKYRQGLASLDEAARSRFGRPFAALSPADRQKVLDQASPTFVRLLMRHTIEGLLCAPEYGGNLGRVGWQLVGFNGDSQPLGYEIYDTSTGTYRERPEKPNSGPNPDERCEPFSERMNRFLTLIAGTPPTQPGQRFGAPFCLGVPT